jgi:hypothetical protein
MKTPKLFSEESSVQQLILLLGSPRSGTSWLAKILDTHPNVFYTHEPLDKTWVPRVQELVKRLRGGGLGPEERLILVDEIDRARHHHVKPPFFRKSFVKCPPTVRGMIWGLMALANRGKSRFARWFSPARDCQHDLLVKEVDWLGFVPQLMTGLRPDRLVVIARHPCAVVSSRLRGVRLGTMSSYRTGWLERHGERCHDLGFSSSQVEQMDLCQFFALTWLLQNIEYQEAVRDHPCATTVSYEDLCRNPAGVADRLFAFLGWEQNPQTAKFIAASTGQGFRGRVREILHFQSAYYGLYKDPSKASASWKNALTLEQQRAIMSIASASSDGQIREILRKEDS